MSLRHFRGAGYRKITPKHSLLGRVDCSFAQPRSNPLVDSETSVSLQKVTRDSIEKDYLLYQSVVILTTVFSFFFFFWREINAYLQFWIEFAKSGATFTDKPLMNLHAEFHGDPNIGS